MRQHVMAFLVALVVWMMSNVCYDFTRSVHAKGSSSDLFSECRQVVGETILAVHCYPYPPPPSTTLCGGWCSRYELDNRRCQGLAWQLRCVETIQTMPADWFIGNCAQNIPWCNECTGPWYWQGVQWIPVWKCQ